MFADPTGGRIPLHIDQVGIADDDDAIQIMYVDPHRAGRRVQRAQTLVVPTGLSDEFDGVIAELLDLTRQVLELVTEAPTHHVAHLGLSETGDAMQFMHVPVETDPPSDPIPQVVMLGRSGEADALIVDILVTACTLVAMADEDDRNPPARIHG